MAVALLQAQAGTDVLVVDGDRHRRTLSILLQQNHAAGLWDAIPAGTPIHPLAIRLASPNAWFVPAGTRTLAAGGVNLWHVLHDNAGPFRLVLLNAGVWPSPDLGCVLPASDQVYAIVRCGTTQRKHYREFCQRLGETGKNLAGCIVSGTFE
jgi:hypothetical protein